MYSQRNNKLESSYNGSAHTLKPLSVQEAVRVQNRGKWDKTGKIVDVLPHRQYSVKMDGSGRLTIRNRRFLKEVSDGKKRKFVLPSATLPSKDHSATLPNATLPSDDHMEANSTPPNSPTREPVDDEPPEMTDDGNEPINEPTTCKLPKALRELETYNKEGLLDQNSAPPQTRLRSGRL